MDDFLDSIFDNSKSLFDNQTFILKCNHYQISENYEGIDYCLNYWFNDYMGDIINFNEKKKLDNFNMNTVDELVLIGFENIGNLLEKKYNIESRIISDNYKYELKIGPLNHFSL